jgi:hypothetical protein
LHDLLVGNAACLLIYKLEHDLWMKNDVKAVNLLLHNLLIKNHVSTGYSVAAASRITGIG